MKIKSENFNIKASNNKIQMLILILVWLCFIPMILSQSIELIIPWMTICILITIWLFTVKLEILNNKVIYTSGIIKQEILINSIESISSSFYSSGVSSSRDVTIQSSDTLSKNIVFNIRYFSKKDFVSFLKNLNKINPKINYDKKLEKLLN